MEPLGKVEHQKTTQTVRSDNQPMGTTYGGGYKKHIPGQDPGMVRLD